MLPNANLTIKDGALGVATEVPSGVQVKIGTCSKGTVNELVSVGDPTTLRDRFGVGPLVEAALLALSEAGGPVIVCKAPNSTNGGLGPVTKVGAGTGTMTVAATPLQAITVKFTVAGELGVAKFQYSLDGGTTWSAEQLLQGTGIFQVPETLTKLTFTAGAPPSFQVNDQYVFALDGTVTKTGTGSGSAVQESSTADAFDVLVEITQTGENIAAGDAFFRYSLDGGKTFSADIFIPASGKYAIPNVGITLTFVNGGAGTSFIKGDKHSFGSTAPTYTLAELTAAVDACLASAESFGFIHVVGAGATPADAASMFTALAAKMATAESQFRYIFSVIELPDDTDANLSTPFLALADTRVMVCAGFEDLTSLLDGRQAKRSSAWPVTARIAKVPASEDLGRVASGPVRGISKLHRNEEKTPGLDGARFTTLRTFVGLAGFFVTNGRMLAPIGSDFEFVQHRRVMDIGSATVRAAMLQYVNDSVRVDSATGKILEADAKTIERALEQRLRDAITQPGLASDVSVVVDRNENILATKTLKVTFRIVPFGYVKQLEGEIGFSNPALSLA